MTEKASYTMPDFTPLGARLSQPEALRIAVQTAEKRGISLSNYKRPEVKYRTNYDEKYWIVFYDGKRPMPGNHFWIRIDDRTGTARIIPGA